MKNSLMLVLSLLLTGALGAQNFQRTIHRTNTDFNHYSIEEAANGDFILAGTLFESGNNLIHVVRMDANGNVICERTLDLSTDDRALDITEDPSQRMVVTGYTTVNGIPELIIARFFSSCDCDQHKVVSGFDASAGTNIIWSGANQSYIVGGMRSDAPFSFPLTNNHAIVLEFDPNLTLGNALELSGPDHMHSSINDIIEIPSGFFVTGSVDDNVPIQGVLAAFLDNSLNLYAHLNFESTNSEHVGVSAVFNQQDDRIYLMSNNSVIHNPQITHIDNASSSTPSLGNHYYLELDPTYGSLNAAGFELRPSINGSDYLVAAGYFRTHDFGGAPFNNATPWVAEFDKLSGTNLNTILYQSHSTNFHAHGGGTFSTFSGEHPYIFNQEILATNASAGSYVFLGARIVNNNFSLDVVGTDMDPTLSTCLFPYLWDPPLISSVDIDIVETLPSLSDNDYPFSCVYTPSNIDQFCTSTCQPGQQSQNFQRTIELSNTDHNHYSIETVSSCEYALAGTEFKSGGNDIHVLMMDDAGSLLWEKYIDLSADDRALDIAEDQYGNLIVVGYTTVSGTPEMYIVKMDAAGNCLNDRIVGVYDANAATNVIYSDANDSYIIGGTRDLSFSFPLTESRAVVMEMDLNLNITNILELFSTDEEGASINDIVEIPGGYFVTGSHDFNNLGISYQGVLAMFLDNNLNPTANLSFESTNSEHVGVSAIYDDQSDQVYLMSNNSVIHNPQITTIDNVSSGPAIINQYYLELDPTYGQYNAAGFELHKSVSNPADHLVAAGYFRTYTIGGTSNNATAWITEFERGGGAHIQTILYDAPSTNFHAHGGGIFSTFSGEHPYIFNQEILTERADGHGYVYLAPRRINGNYAVDVISTDMNIDKNSCMEDYIWDVINISEDFIGTSDDVPTPWTNTPSANCPNENSILSINCNVSQKGNREQPLVDQAETPEGMQVYPNPTSDRVSVVVPDASRGGELVVMNALGEVVFTTRTLGDNQALTFDLSEQRTGLYFVIYSDDARRMVSKVMKR